MPELPVYGSFDLACCLDDAVNYLLSVAELYRAVHGLAANLAPDGILIFDSNTLGAHLVASPASISRWRRTADG